MATTTACNHTGGRFPLFLIAFFMTPLSSYKPSDPPHAPFPMKSFSMRTPGPDLTHGRSRVFQSRRAPSPDPGPDRDERHYIDFHILNFTRPEGGGCIVIRRQPITL